MARFLFLLGRRTIVEIPIGDIRSVAFTIGPVACGRWMSVKLEPNSKPDCQRGHLPSQGIIPVIIVGVLKAGQPELAYIGNTGSDPGLVHRLFQRGKQQRRQDSNDGNNH